MCPYIDQNSRDRIEDEIVIFSTYDDEYLHGVNPINEIASRIKTNGDLNYVLTRICLQFLLNQPKQGYQERQNIVGTLECCKQEFVRRVLDKYEEIKIIENGDLDDYEKF